MDPNASFGRLCEQLADAEHEDALESADALRGWIQRGGFSPQPNLTYEQLWTLLGAARDSLILRRDQRALIADVRNLLQPVTLLTHTVLDDDLADIAEAAQDANDAVCRLLAKLEVAWDRSCETSAYGRGGEDG